MSLLVWSVSAAKSAYSKAFRMPTPVRITGRTSSITNSFVNGVIPSVMPSDEEIARALEVLGMDASDVRCAYCGDPATEWDHLNAIVRDKRPTGYISEIHNLVPACGKCNQSKGNKPWRLWMLGSSPLSPASRGVTDVEKRVERIAEYERLFPSVRIDFEAMVDKSVWKAYWDAHRDLVERVRRCEELAAEVRAEVLCVSVTSMASRRYSMDGEDESRDARGGSRNAEHN